MKAILRSSSSLLLLIGAALGCRAQEIRPVPTSHEADSTGAPFAEDASHEKFAYITADAKNRVWAAFKAQGARLAWLKSDRWETIALKTFPHAIRACGMARLKDGSIACLWRDEAVDRAYLISCHAGSAHEVIARFDVTLESPRLLPLNDGGLLITQSGRDMIRIGKGGVDPAIITLPEDVFLPPKKNDDGSQSSSHAAVHAVQHHKDTIWLWSPALQKQEHQWRLRGLLRLSSSGASFEELPDCPDDAPISVVAPFMEGRLAIAVAGVALLSFDVARKHHNIYRDLEELRHVERIFESGGRWHVVTTPKPDQLEVKVSPNFRNQLVLSTSRFYDPQNRATALLDLHGTELHPITWKLDPEPFFGWWDRPILTSREGLWVGSRSGAIFQPSAPDKELLQHDSRRLMHILPAGKGRVIALDDSGSTFLLPARPASKKSPPRVTMQKTASLLVEDDLGRIWGRMPDGGIHRWEEAAWKPLETPDAVLKMGNNAFTRDDSNQGWLIPMQDGPAAVCDFSTGIWEIFPNLTQALQKRLQASTRLRLRDWPGLSPFSSGGKLPRIAFLRMDGILHHFDGELWKSWPVRAITGGDAKTTGAPYFDHEARLKLSIEDNDWQLGLGSHWTNLGRSPDKRPRINHSDESSPPPGCPVPYVSSTAYDRFGVCWLSDNQRRLWKCVHGRAVQVLQPGEPDPTHGNGVSLYEAHADAMGNVFLRTTFGWDGADYLLVRNRLPVPHSTAKQDEPLADTVRIRFGEASWHAWRIDGREWSEATENQEHVFTGLLPGTREIEVIAFNADLTPAKSSAKLRIDIQAAVMREIEELVARLGGDDLEASEAAARRLRSQGKSLLPALRARRETASERARWWIDAIIQRIDPSETLER